MKLVAPEPSYFEEVGEIMKWRDRLKDVGIGVVFRQHGMQLENKQGVATEIYQTSAELRAYRLAFQDGYQQREIGTDMVSFPGWDD